MPKRVKYEVPKRRKVAVSYVIDYDLYLAIKGLMEQQGLSNPNLIVCNLFRKALALEACDTPYDYAARYHTLHDKVI